MGAAMTMGAVVLCVAGCAEVPWRSYSSAPASPNLEIRASARVTLPSVVILDPAHEYSLVELIDRAQRANPDTRAAWEQARASSARLGITEAVYLPVLAIAVSGGAKREAYPSPLGPFSVTGPFVEPRLDLTWNLLDLPRFADVEVARALSQRANFDFTRRHQEVMFAVASAFYALDASHARLDAAETTLRSATVDEEAVQARLRVGLATRPELLLAREARARAAFDLEAAHGQVRSSEAALATVVGAAPVLDLRIASLDLQQLPERLGAPIQRILETALRERPDLQALAASVRAREGLVRRSKRTFAPRLSLAGSVSYLAFRFEIAPQGETLSINSPQFDTHLRFDWDLFDGFSRLNQVRSAEAEREESVATLTAGALRALREAWTAYFDAQTAQRKVEFAKALLESAQEAYDASLETYRHGLGTVIDLLTAERDLANARMTSIESRAELLTAAAAIALAIGAPQAATR
jgi:outer membrane protein TolC